MATQQTVGELVYKITGDIGDLQTSVKKAEAEIKKLEQQMKDSEKATRSAEGAASKFGKALKLIGGAIAGGAVLSFLKSSAQEALNLLEVQTQLSQVLRVSTNATDEQIASLKEQAHSLAQVGVISEENILLAQKQFATYDLQSESIAKLVPAFADMIAAERGINAETGDMISFAEGMSKALQGNFQSLRDRGFVFDDATAKILKHGTETERVTALVEILNSTYEGTNKVLGDSLPGKIARAQRSFNDLKQDIGFALLPTVNALTEGIFGVTDGFKDNQKRVNSWGKNIYQVTFGAVAFAKALGFVVKMLTGVADIVGGAVWDSLKGTFKAVTKALTGDFSGAYDVLKETGEKGGEAITEKTKAWIDVLSDDVDSFSSTLAKAGGEGFSEVTEAAIAAYDATAKSNEAFVDSNEDAEKAIKKAKDELDDFRGKMLGFIQDSEKVRAALEEDLGKSFKKFGEDLTGTFKDTNEELATIFLDTQEKIAQLKNDLKMEDDGDKRREIRKEIEKQEAILKTREDFEKRQAERLEAIRSRLTEAGIDPASIEGLNQEKTLQDEITEQKRLRDLNEFARFEELQTKKLEKMTTDFITEVNLTRDKIERQKEYEQDLTDFLTATTEVRIAEIDKWAADTIAKHKMVAESLRSLLSLQSQVQSATAKRQFHTGGYVSGDGGEVHSGEYVIPANMVSKFSGLVSALERARVGNSVTNNRTVNAPINIQANPQEAIDFRVVSREIAWSLGSR